VTVTGDTEVAKGSPISHFKRSPQESKFTLYFTSFYTGKTTGVQRAGTVSQDSIEKVNIKRN